MSLKKSAALLALAAAAAAPATASAGTATVKSTNAVLTQGNEVLTAGVNYDIVVTGNYASFPQSLYNQTAPKAWWKTCGTTTPLQFPAGSTGVGGQDAETIYALPVGGGCKNVTPRLPFTAPESGMFRLSIDGTRTLFNPAPVASTPGTHTYVYRVTGQGKAPFFKILDTKRADNAGSLRVTYAVASN